MRCSTGTPCSLAATSATTRRWHRHHTASEHMTAVRRADASASTDAMPASNSGVRVHAA